MDETALFVGFFDDIGNRQKLADFVVRQHIGVEGRLFTAAK